jgi:hypothetical protein
LGFQFSPRLADIGESRFWRLDRAADYGALNGLASRRLNSKLITQNWDDFLRVAGSIKMGKVSASELIRTLQRGSKRSLLAQALGELGRIPKTLHLLTFIDDPCYRRWFIAVMKRRCLLAASTRALPTRAFTSLAFGRKDAGPLTRAFASLKNSSTPIPLASCAQA